MISCALKGTFCAGNHADVNETEKRIKENSEHIREKLNESE